jgi:hypothetical protein
MGSADPVVQEDDREQGGASGRGPGTETVCPVASTRGLPLSPPSSSSYSLKPSPARVAHCRAPPPLTGLQCELCSCLSPRHATRGCYINRFFSPTVHASLSFACLTLFPLRHARGQSSLRACGHGGQPRVEGGECCGLGAVLEAPSFVSAVCSLPLVVMSRDDGVSCDTAASHVIPTSGQMLMTDSSCGPLPS